jgi:hypothetical protein
MPVPSPRNSIRVARGNFADLDANATAFGEGEFIYAIDQDRFYTSTSGSLMPVGAGVVAAEGINTLSDVDTSTIPPGVGQVLKWDGANWTPADDDNTDAVTSVAGKTGDVTLVKADITDFSDADYATAAQGTTADTAVQPGDNVSDLTNDANYIDAAGAPIQSVNTQTGDVVLDADDIDDTSTTNKFATATQLGLADTSVQPGDNVSDLVNDANYITLAEVPGDLVTSVNTQTGDVVLGAGDVGLGNVDNTSDANKPISTATQAALDLKADLIGGVVPNSQLPSLAVTEYLGDVASEAALLTLNGERGDWAIRTDTGSTWIITTDGGSNISDWTELATPADAVTSVNGYTGTVVLGPSDVGAATAAQGGLADSAVQPTDSIDVLADVDISTTAPTDGQALIWDNAGGKFVPGEAGLVDSVNGATGEVVLDTDDIGEGTTNLYSQWDNVTGGIDYAGGLVGIGTTAPDELLHIEGDVAEFKGTNTNSINVTVGTEQVFKFGIEGQKNNVYGPAGSIIFRQDNRTWSSVDANNKPTRIEFCTQDNITTDTSETPRLVISSDGNVGIGTSIPDTLLHLQDTAVNTTNFITLFGDRNAVDTEVGILFKDRNVVSNGTEAGRIYTQRSGSLNSFNLVLSSSKNDTLNDAVIIDPDGNVGIGTTAPQAALDINAAASTSPFIASINSSEAARIDSAGRLLVGTSSSINTLVEAGLQVQGTGADAYASFGRWSPNTANPGIVFNKSRGTSVGTRAIVQNDDNLGELTFTGDDGSAFVYAARIQCQVDGTPGANDMPGRLVFSTTADGASGPTERMRIASGGKVGIGTTNPQAALDINAAASTSPFIASINSSERARIDGSGRLLVGTSTALTTRLITTTLTPSFQVKEGGGGSALFFCGINTATPATVFAAKSRGTSYGTIVQNNDGLLRISAAGDDGVQATEAARIEAFVDGTPGANDMPGRLVFSTTASGASSPTERMRIKNDGTINFSNVAVYADNTAAKAGGLVDGDVYRTSTGDLKIVYT